MPQPIFVPAVSAPDAGADISRQTSTTLARLDERLRAEHSSLADATVITVYLRKAADFAAMNDAYRQAWKALPPTRTTVIAPPLAADALVEMSAVAVPAGGERRLVHPQSWSPSPNPYSYGLRCGDTLYLSGLISRNGRDNTVVDGDVAKQTKTVLDNAKELLEAAGLSLPHVVGARVFLPNGGDFDEMNRVYREYFPDAPPARATVIAGLTAPNYKVEMTFIASAGARRAIDAEPKSPNLSAAVATGDAVYFAGLLPDAAALGGYADAQTRNILEKLDALLGKAGVSRGDVRDLLVYVVGDVDAGAAVAACRSTFGAKAAITPVHVSLVNPSAKVEVMATAVKP